VAPASPRGYGSEMRSVRFPPTRRALGLTAGALALSLAVAPRRARAQDSTRPKPVWVGVGAIGRTAMFMDTTSIERDGAIRRVWMESVDPEPTTFVVGRDTTRFDTVVALHVFDCRAATHTVATARYYLAGSSVAPPRPADTSPDKLRPGTFMAAVAADLCGAPRPGGR